MTQFPALARSIELKGIVFRNRIALAPMNTNFGEADGTPGEAFTRYYVERGRGGAGLLFVSSAYIDPAVRKRAGALLLHDDALIPKFSAFVDAIHATGAKVIQQINHNGRLLKSSKELRTAVTADAVGPSAVPHLSTGEVPKVLTVSEIKALVEQYGQAARRARDAGFDGVEIHGTHGYLINQFYSRYSNRRTDDYGGSLEKRLRFPLEVYRRVRELVGEDFLICYRLNGRSFEPVETPLDDVIALGRRLEAEGIDLLHVSAGTSETPSMVLRMIPPGSVPQGCYADLAGAVKAAVGVPVVSVGRITTPQEAEGILAGGKADFVALGRALIADPYWPQKALSGAPETIRRCIGCNQGCMEQLVQEQKVTCLYNPEVSGPSDQPLAAARKRVMVVGGGPAGMEAALVAARRGHSVVLYEKEDRLGGQIPLAAAPPGKGEFAAVGEFLSRELSALEVDVHLNTTVTADIVKQVRPDIVILATGSIPAYPDCLGMDRANVVTAREVLQGRPVGNRVAVVGGGLVGCETALYLKARGKTVELIEMLERVAADAGPLNRARILDELAAADIRPRCDTRLCDFRESGDLVCRAADEYELNVDTVVLATGAVPQAKLRRELEGLYPIYCVGDCQAPRNMLAAIHEAYQVAMQI